MSRMAYKYLIVLMSMFVLLDYTEASWFRKAIRTVGKGLEKGVKAVGDGVEDVGKALNKGVGCKIFFGVACPVAVGTAGAAATVGSGGTATVAVAAGTIATTSACALKTSDCKRSAINTLIPFSDDIRDYDSNGDKLVSYEEFVFAVMRSVELTDPTELEQPFLFADFNVDGVLDVQEFNSAPLLFAHASVHMFQHTTQRATVTPVDNSTTS